MKRNPLYGLIAFKVAHGFAKTFPRALCHQLATTIGRVSYARSHQVRDTLRANLALLTGLQGDALDALCNANVANFSKMLADYFYCTTDEPVRIRRLLGEWHGFENLVAARERGKGIVLITAHLGNWELGGLLLALEGLPMTVVTIEEPSTELTRWRDSYRRRLGIKTITVGSDKFAFVEMINTLRRNEIVAMLVDRPYENSGTPVQFLGQETLFSTAPALLWQHTDAAVLPAFVLQNKSGRYLSFADPMIPLEKAENPREALTLNTQRIASIFEAIIRRHPDQWFNYVPILEGRSRKAEGGNAGAGAVAG